MIMKILFSALLLILLNSCAIQSKVNESSDAQIIVERPENNGSINTCPCDVKLNANKKIVLIGGQTNFFSVKAGTYFLTANSINFYPGATKNSNWKPSSLKIVVTNSQTVEIVVEPKSEGSAYTGGWVLTSENP
jgi:hypothetical protein